MVNLFDSKRCFTCNRPKFLFQFSKNTATYQRPQNKGTNFNCRLCECKSLKGGKACFKINDKFQVIPVKYSFWLALKYYFKGNRALLRISN
jgi:hypothetical protein